MKTTFRSAFARLPLGVAPLAFSALAACAGSETGNAGREALERPLVIELRLTAESAAEGPVAVDRDGFELPITRATALVEKLDFLLPEGEGCPELPMLRSTRSIGCTFEEDEGLLRIEGPWVVDLLTGVFEPSLDDVILPAGAYEEVRLLISGKDGAPSLALGGLVEVGGVEHDFELFVLPAIPARFGADEGLVLSDDTTGLTLDLVVESWFAGLALGSCIEAGGVPEVDGVLELGDADKRLCGDVARTVREFLTVGGRAKVEREGQGERATVPAAASDNAGGASGR